MTEPERPSCRFHQHDLVDRPDPGRVDWIRTDCRRCGRLIGYRPKYEIKRYAGGASPSDLAFNGEGDEDVDS